MYFQQFLSQLHGCATYLIASRDTREAALVDPGVVVDEYEEILRRRGQRQRYVIDTHTHADHASGGRRLAEAQYLRIARLLALPEWAAVFPGHFEEPCGKGMCGWPNSTIGFEKRLIPIARLERDALLSAVTSIPARPLDMSAIEATNWGAQDMGRAMLTADTAIPEVSPWEARDILPHVSNLTGGMTAWREAGLPVEAGVLHAP